MTGNCIVDNCKGKVVARNLCQKHYRRFLRNGNTDLKHNEKKCDVNGCERAALGQGLCKVHYNLWKKCNMPDVKKTKQGCLICGCDNKVKLRGLCEGHYKELLCNCRKNKLKVYKLNDKEVIKLLENIKIKNNKICLVEGCDRKVECRGFCKHHYNKWYAHGNPLYVAKKSECKIINCSKKHYAQGFCENHYGQYVRREKELEVENIKKEFKY